ncbi:S1C family serine protease [Oleisolibacter albus]|uniref:S1C family serine protease n=1 Tax=Oleisolibacter albus TaxID=2171757 RepID=UPI000DF3763F|nr:serine protease [Oleisolibacter albus]
MRQGLIGQRFGRWFRQRWGSATAFGVLALAVSLAGTAWGQPAPDAAAKQARIEALRAMLDRDICQNRAEAEALLAAGAPPAPTTPPGSAPAKPVAAEVAPAGMPPAPSPDKTGTATEAAKPEPDTPRRLSRAALVERLKAAVVLVIAGEDSGSGFFISPTLILTNYHVIEKAKDGTVIVVGRGTNTPRRARIVAMAPTSAQNQRDYAVLEIEGPGAAVTLGLSGFSSELDDVVAAGYPGLLLANDQNFTALIGGDLTALPELAFSQGQVMARQNSGRGVMTLAHSAAISGGNSGGPLVDACGNVIGINSFINVSVEQASRAGFALAATDVMDFLGERGVGFTRIGQPCPAAN